MISLKNVSYSINGKVILKNVNLNFKANQLNLILGVNGAGKSTLLKIICNQIDDYQGEVLYDGKNIKSLQINELAKVRAVLSQSVDLSFPLKVEEIVMMGRYPHFKNKANDKDVLACQEAIDFFDLNEFKNRQFNSLSGGEKQRVHFARILAQLWYANKDELNYLLLDEPLTYLDIYYQFNFLEKIKSILLKRNILVIGVIHDLNLCAKFADYITLLHQNVVYVNGLKNEVLTSELILEVFKVRTKVKILNENLTIDFL